MKRMYLILLVLAIAGLACTKTATSTTTSTTALANAAPTLTNGEGAGAAAAEIDHLVEASPQICARVTAEEALHLREIADPGAPVLAYLGHGDLVRVITADDANWWRVEWGGLVGWARSSFLERADCE